MRILALFTLVALAFLSGCAGKAAPERHLYLLRADVTNQFSETMPVADIGIGALAVASYIDQPGLVIENADGSITVARYHEWAEPLRESVRMVLSNRVAHAIGKPVRARGYGETNWKQITSRMIDVQIQQLHGTADGHAVLVAYWAVLDPTQREVLSEHEFSATAALAEDGYDALVAAEKKLLFQLAEDIATALQDM